MQGNQRQLTFSKEGIITLTKHPSKRSKRPAPQGAGAPEALVTREMRDAGAAVIEELKDVVSASGLAEAVYIAMVHTPKP